MFDNLAGNHLPCHWLESKMASSNEPWVRVREVAEHLGVSASWVHKAVQTDSIPARRVGRNVRFRLSEIDAWLERDSHGAS